MSQDEMLDEDVAEQSPLEVVEARRLARKAKVRQLYETQKAADLEAIDELEDAHGDSNVAIVEVPFTVGLPVLVAARTPTPVETKRYRETQKVKGDQIDHSKAISSAEALATQCLIYPDKETYQKIRETRPGVAVALGLEALKLAGAKALADAKP